MVSASGPSSALRWGGGAGGRGGGGRGEGVGESRGRRTRGQDAPGTGRPRACAVGGGWRELPSPVSPPQIGESPGDEFSRSETV